MKSADRILKSKPKFAGFGNTSSEKSLRYILHSSIKHYYDDYYDYYYYYYYYYYYCYYY